MSTHEWHVDDGSLTAYSGGTAAPVLAASVEAHLLGCAGCRDRLAAQVDPGLDPDPDPDQRLRLRSLLTAAPTVVMSTHDVSEVAALCQSVYVMFAGRIRFAGTPAELAALASGRVWEDDAQDPRAVRSWTTPTGTYRHLGDPPAGAQVVAPTLDDGYLLLAREAHALPTRRSARRLHRLALLVPGRPHRLARLPRHRPRRRRPGLRVAARPLPGPDPHRLRRRARLAGPVCRGRRCGRTARLDHPRACGHRARGAARLEEEYTRAFPG